MKKRSVYQIITITVLFFLVFPVSVCAENTAPYILVLTPTNDWQYTSYHLYYTENNTTISLIILAGDSEDGVLTSQIQLSIPEGVSGAVLQGGHFTWTPTICGTYTFTLTVTDTGGLTATNAFIIEVSNANYLRDHLIPLPRSIVPKELPFFSFIHLSCVIITDLDSSDCQNSASWLQERILKRTKGTTNLSIIDESQVDQLDEQDTLIYVGLLPENTSNGYMYDICSRRDIVLPTYEEFQDQGYLIDMFNDASPRPEIIIVARKPAGLFYGATTLSEMVSPQGYVAGASILDFPHFEKRNYYPSWLVVVSSLHPDTLDLNSNSDWLATKKYNYVAEMYPREMPLLYTEYRTSLSIRFRSYISHLMSRYMQYIPGVGQFKHHQEYLTPNTDDSPYQPPHHLELTENYYTENEQFHFVTNETGVEIAHPEFPYENVLDDSGIDGDFETDMFHNGYEDGVSGVEGSDGMPDGWAATGINSPMNTMVWTWDTTRLYSGSASMKCDIEADASSTGPSLECHMNGPAVKPNSYYIVTFWFQKQSLDASSLQFVLYSKSGDLLDNTLSQYNPSESATDGWKKGFILIKTTATSDSIIFYTRVSGANGGVGTVWVDNVTVRRLDGALLNVVRQPDFPEHDIVVKDFTDPLIIYREGVDYLVVNGSIGTGGLAEKTGGLFDPDGDINVNNYENPGSLGAVWWVPERGGDPVSAPGIIPFRIQRIPTGSIPAEGQILVSYNAFYTRNPELYFHKPLALGDPRNYNMNWDDLYHSRYYENSFKGLYEVYTTLLDTNGQSLPNPEFISILGDEMRGLGTDSRSIHSGVSMEELLARMVNNLNEKAKEYDPNVTIIMYSDIVDPYFTGGIDDNQVQFGGPSGRLANTTEQELLSKDVALMHWTDKIYNMYSSLNFFLSKGYQPTPDIWTSYNEPDIMVDLIQILAAQHKKIPLITMARANNGQELPFPIEADERAVDYLWNPRYATIFVDSFENYDHPEDTTLQGWSTQGDVTYYTGGSSTRVHQTQDGLFNLRSIGLRNSGSISLTEDLNVTPHREFMLEGYIKLETGTPQASPLATIEWYDPNNLLLSTNTTTIDTASITSSAFHAFNLTAVSPNNAQKAKLILSGSSANEWYWFDNIMFKKSLSLEYNHPPILSCTPLTLTVENEASIALPASDEDYDELFWNASQLPSGATMSSTGTFTWRPTNQQIGEYNITITVTDGIFTERRTLHIHVYAEQQFEQGGNEGFGSNEADLELSGNNTTQNESQYDNHPPESPMQPSGPHFVQQGITYIYTSTTTDADGDLIRLQFDWGDNTISEWSEFVSSNTIVSMSHQWNSSTAYSVRAIAQDENDLYSNWSPILDILVSSINSDDENQLFFITISGDTTVNQTIVFDTPANVILDKNIVSYYWDFGDGGNSTEKNPSHVYKYPGQYTVHLVVTDEEGTMYTKNMTITVASAVGQQTGTLVTPGFDLGVLLGVITLITIMRRKKLR